MHAPAPAASKLKLWPYVLLITAAMAGVAAFQWPEPPTDPIAMIHAPTQQAQTMAEPKPQPGTPPMNAPEPSPPTAAIIAPKAEAPWTAPAAVRASADIQTPEIVAAEDAEPAELEEVVEWVEITPQSPAVDLPPDIAATPEKPAIPNVHALPPSTQRQLPAIAIAAQIYDNDPASRMALINGRSVREGEVIAPGLILESIGENGIVLNFQGQRFQMDVFQNWSGN
ncbi:MAG: general secretion pathway protein GspB [Mariprofundaceae bacterium]